MITESGTSIFQFSMLIISRYITASHPPSSPSTIHHVRSSSSMSGVRGTLNWKKISLTWSGVIRPQSSWRVEEEREEEEKRKRQGEEKKEEEDDHEEEDGKGREKKEGRREGRIKDGRMRERGGGSKGGIKGRKGGKM